MRIAELPCTTETGMGGPPQCRDGVADGTVVPFFPYFACDGWGTPDSLRERLLDPSARPLAVIEYPTPIRSAVWDGPEATHVLLMVFNGYGDPGTGIRLLDTIAFDARGVVDVVAACGAYSGVAFEGGELPDELDPATVIWRAFQPS